jgi:hypothetical protein
MLLAGPDTMHLSHDVQVSDAVRAKLEEEKQRAQLASDANAVHCPEWLGAQVHPHGSRGGYSYLIETEDFTVKVLGRNIPHRPGLYLELRSHFLHTHPEGPKGVCAEALCWVRDQLLYDQDDEAIDAAVSFAGVRLSRVDLHCDWQCGWELSPADMPAFIKPARGKWQLYSEGTTFTGMVFGRGSLQTRIYRKSLEAQQKDMKTTLPCCMNERATSTIPTKTCGGWSSSCGGKGLVASSSTGSRIPTTMKQRLRRSSPPRISHIWARCHASLPTRRHSGST